MDGVAVAVGFSGHGFKMASSLGAVAADLIAEGTTATEVSFMDPARFLPPQHSVADLPLDDGAASGRGALVTGTVSYAIGDLLAGPGSQVRGNCLVRLGTSTVSLPVVITHGSAPGPVLAVTAGIHGGGIRADRGGPAVHP